MRIAFLDHHLSNYHADVFLAILRNELSTSGTEVVAAFETHPSGEDWCEKNGVPRFNSVEEAMSLADAGFVLAPDEIQAHPSLCADAIPSGKPLFIDKLLAPTVAESLEIVHRAADHGVPLLASSALWHSVELEEALSSLGSSPELAVVRGYGEWGRYGVHTVAMALRSLGPGVCRLINTGSVGAEMVTVEYSDGRRCSIQVFNGEQPSKSFPWTFGLRSGEQLVSGQVSAFHEFYVNQLSAASEMFRSEISPMSSEEALDTAAILEMAVESRQRGGEWIEL